eukprot:1292900-Ditylum_brightwellii.AAC.1
MPTMHHHILVNTFHETEDAILIIAVLFAVIVALSLLVIAIIDVARGFAVVLLLASESIKVGYN